MKKNWKKLTFYIAVILLTALLVIFLFPKAKSPQINHKTEVKKEALTYVALGDSLTEGVGDEESEGFVLRLADDLEKTYPLEVQTKNYGKAGDRSDQITKRLKANKDEQAMVKKANVITLTVGGNDLLQTLSRNIEEIKPSVLTKARQKYGERLTQLYDTIRQYNKKAVIYQLGIYNPFYYDFKYVQDLQKSINQWNSTAESIVATQKRSYFIPINDVISKGTEKDQQQTDSSDDLKNHLLSREDYFHPNSQGYTMMANKVIKEMKATKYQWWPQK